MVAGIISLFGGSAAVAASGQASSEYDRQVAQGTPGSNPLTGTKQMMVVRVSVSDYARFRTSFDTMESPREAAGVSNPQVFRNATNQNDVAVFFDIIDTAKAKAFMGTDMLRAKMKDAGVLGPPTILFT
jgi:hypothetical protein